MNFFVIEDFEGKKIVKWENEAIEFPKDTILFTIFHQNMLDENGKVETSEYIIGKPIKIIIGDMHLELDSTNQIDNSLKEDYHYQAVYTLGNIKKFFPLNKNTTLVRDFNELEKAFYSELKKSLGESSKTI